MTREIPCQESFLITPGADITVSTLGSVSISGQVGSIAQSQGDSWEENVRREYMQRSSEQEPLSIMGSMRYGDNHVYKY